MVNAWPQNAYVGQRVVALGTFEPRSHAPNLPKKGIVYTIRTIVIAPTKGAICFTFNELRNPIFLFADGMSETVFMAEYFRPVDESKIDMFRQIAKNPRVSIPA